MPTFLGVLAFLAVNLFWTAANAQPVVVSARPDAVSVTLYREEGLTSRDLQTDPSAADRGLVMVTETRTVDLPAGPARVAFRGVADGMLPQTAAVTGLGAPVAEQDFDYDLLTPGALAARSVGQRVTLRRTNAATGAVTTRPATIRSAPKGIVLAFDDGTTEALDCSGLPEALVFERVPAGLADRPTLSALVRSPAAGRRTVRLSYLATGLAWSADYVARIAPDGRTLDLTGWLTLANNGDTTFGRAPTDVVAGTLNREQVAAIEPTLLRREDRCWPRPVRWNSFSLADFSPPPPAPPPPPMVMSAPAEASRVEEVVVTGARVRKAVRSDLGDYKLYTLPEPTTVAARQVKQVAFLDQQAVPFERIYEARHNDLEEDPAPIPVLLRMANTAAGGLGEPLPAGTAVVMAPTAAGRPLYAGGDEVEDTAVGLPFELTLGGAFDVQASLTQGDDEDRTNDRVRTAYTAELTNARRGPVRIELRGPAYDGLRIVAEDVRSTRKDGAPLWTLDLAPGERRTFRYTLEYDG